MDIVNQVISILNEQQKTRSIAQIAIRSGINRKTLNNWIYKRSKPSLESAEKLLNTFGLTLKIMEVSSDKRFGK